MSSHPVLSSVLVFLGANAAILVILAVAQNDRNSAAPRMNALELKLDVPEPWHTSAAIPANGMAPIHFVSFTGAYPEGGVFPPEGAEITITRVAASVGLVNLINQELLDATAIEKKESFLKGDSAIELSYVDSFGADLNIFSDVVLLQHRTWIYKYYLSARAENPQLADLRRQFRRIVLTSEFVE